MEKKVKTYIIERFIKYLTFEKRYSHHTIIAYECDLNAFQVFMLETYEIEDWKLVESTHIRSWIVSLMRNGKSNTTVNRKVASLKSFYKYLELHSSKEIINPTKSVITPKRKERLPSFIKPEEIENLLEDVVDKNDYILLRNKIIMELLYATGVRRSELMTLTINNINFQHHYIKVRGKRNKERIIPISVALANDLKEYWQVRLSQFENEVDIEEIHFFLTQKGKPLYPKAIYNIVKNYLERFTTVEQKSPHVLRHSFATHLLNNGAELNAIKELLGHESLAATQVYTHTTLNKLKKAYLKAHPKASN